MARDQPWREVSRVLRKNGWKPKDEGKGNGSSHVPYVNPHHPGKTLNFPKHGRDGDVKAVYIQEMIDTIGRENCPESWFGGRMLGQRDHERRLRAEAEQRRLETEAKKLEAERKLQAAASKATSQRGSQRGHKRDTSQRGSQRGNKRARENIPPSGRTPSPLHQSAQENIPPSPKNASRRESRSQRGHQCR